ncbi:MAG: glycosyltransferase family 1 protein, partial [Methanobacteriota archaeon]
MDVRRALFLSWYDEAGPSSRVRFYQYFPHLAEHGLACEAAPLFPRRYVETFFTTGRRPLGVVLRAYLDRLRSMRRLRDYDVLVIEKELLPYLPAPFERRLRSSGVPIVADYDDAVHHRYDRSRNPVVRALLATKIARLMRAADAVIVGNPYLRTYAEAAGARRVELLP